MNNNIEELKIKLKEMGVVGAGGASFPSYAKLAQNIEYVLINGAECEPLLRVDQQLSDLHAKELLETLSFLVKTLGARKGVFALKGKYKKAVESLNKNLHFNNVEIFELDNFYPAGDEQITIYEAFGKIVPEGGIPLNVGVVVFNVETLLNINRALKDIPVTHTYLTVTGAVHTPKTIKVPVGITFKDAINLAGGSTVSDYVTIAGGPMMGKVNSDLDKPIAKNSKGIIVLPKEHHLVMSKTKSLKSVLKETRTACCHCSLCSDLCPRNLLGHKLEPDKLMRISSYGSTCSKDEDISTAYLCCECGLCELACVMNLQPFKLNKFLKTTLREKGVKNTHNNLPKETHPSRKYRKYPIKKLISKVGLTKYDLDAPLEVKEYDFKEVTLLTKQNIGVSATPVVAVGDRVVCGDVIAVGNNDSLSVNLHCSINGVVKYVDGDKVVVRGE